jgi:hypothetical protein
MDQNVTETSRLVSHAATIRSKNISSIARAIGTADVSLSAAASPVHAERAASARAR